MTTCLHEVFTAEVAVNRITDETVFVADVRLSCASCGVRLRFLGVPVGVSFDGPTVSVDGTELRAPVEPAPPPGADERRGGDG